MVLAQVRVYKIRRVASQPFEVPLKNLLFFASVIVAEISLKGRENNDFELGDWRERFNIIDVPVIGHN